MTVSEFRKKGGFLQGDRYGLSIVLGGRTEDQLVEEFRQAKAVLLEWFRTRGKSRELVMFVVTTGSMHAVADATIRDIVAQEQELARPLQEREVRVSLLGGGGKPVREASWSRGRWDDAPTPT